MAPTVVPTMASDVGPQPRCPSCSLPPQRSPVGGPRCRCGEKRLAAERLAVKHEQQHGAILALLRTVDAHVTAELVEQLLARVAAAASSRSQLGKHLAADPSVLTRGGSRMPKVVGEFLYAALDAGVGGIVAPSCALCSRPRTLFHAYGDGERICTSCYSRARTATCSVCGRPGQRIKTTTADGAVCERCHQQARPPEDCAGCGRTRILTRSRNDGQGYCRACRSRRALTEPCAVCGQHRHVNARATDGGALCSTCYARTRTAQDACEECGILGPLAARAGGTSTTSRNLCIRCYRHPRRTCGICGRLNRIALKATATSPDVCPTCYQAPVIDCSVCGQQALGRRTTNHGRPRCFTCQATQQIDAALTGPDHLIRPELKPVRDALLATDTPRSLLNNWHNLPSLHLLADIAQGRIELAHDALDARPQVFSLTYLRALLVASGALPPRDENAARLHRHIADVAAAMTDPELRHVFTRYARWHVLGRVKTNRHGHLSATVAGRCRTDIHTARVFLDHLAAHAHDLDDCPQSFLEAWLATDRDRRLVFLRWLTRHGYLARTRLPGPVTRRDPGHAIDPSQQLNRARQLLHDPDSASTEDRAAACLILLYAQPATKIVTLTTSDIHTRDGDTYLSLGPEPLLLIPPLDALVVALPVAKPFGTASALANPQWLFTGKNAGTHLHPDSLIHRMHNLGITTRTSRNTALLHLASTTPPAVFATIIGINISTATR